MQHSTQATWWCNKHSQEHLAALRNSIGEAQWKATAVPYLKRQPAVTTDCRFCQDRDAVEDGLCRRHAVLYRQARKRAGPRFVEAEWVARQVGLSGTGNCQIVNCQCRARRLRSRSRSLSRTWLRHKTAESTPIAKAARTIIMTKSSIADDASPATAGPIDRSRHATSL